MLICLSCITGLQHVGCYFVPRFSSNLRLLEGETPELSDDPRTRENPIQKCGTTAQLFNFRIFAVSVGYCISGSNRLSDYQYISNSFCDNGDGGYVSGYFVMDVYQIQDQQRFLDSVVQVPETTTTNANANTDLALGNNGAPAINTSITLLLGVAIITLLCVLLH